MKDGYWSSFGANGAAAKEFAETFDNVLGKLVGPETCIALLKDHPTLTSEETWKKLLLDALENPLLGRYTDQALDRIVGAALLLCMCDGRNDEARLGLMRDLVVWLHGGAPANIDPVKCYWQLRKRTVERVWYLLCGAEMAQYRLRIGRGGPKQGMEGLDLRDTGTVCSTDIEGRREPIPLLGQHGVDVTFTQSWDSNSVRKEQLVSLKERFLYLDLKVWTLEGESLDI